MQRRVFLARTLPFVAAVVVAKIVIEQLDWEFTVISPLHTSIVAGAIFTVGLMLTGTMSDYKESERVPTETAAAMKAIHREVLYVKEAQEPDRIAGDLADDLDLVADLSAQDDGQVHFAILPGSVAKNRHLLDRTVA